MTRTAFVETSVLTNMLLKEGASAQNAKKTIQSYDIVIIPQFSWKEFKRGPLSYFIWAHNKLTESNSLDEFIDSLHRLSRGLRRYHVSTVLEALSGFYKANSHIETNDMVAKYGDSAKISNIQVDMMRIYIKEKIYRSWNSRKTIFGGARQPLSCYPDADLYEKSGKKVIEYDPSDCPKDHQCCLQNTINELVKFVEVIGVTIDEHIESGVKKKELVDRARTIRTLVKHQNRIMDKKDCRAFGDAYFVLWCPESAEIVTINVADIKPMADALGKSVAIPTENGPELTA